MKQLHFLKGLSKIEELKLLQAKNTASKKEGKPKPKMQDIVNRLLKKDERGLSLDKEDASFYNTVDPANTAKSSQVVPTIAGPIRKEPFAAALSGAERGVPGIEEL